MRAAGSTPRPAPSRAAAWGSAATRGLPLNAAILPLPPAVARRFPAYDAAVLAEPAHRAFVVARLLEEGEGDELRWLFAAVGRPAVAAWLAAHGGAALSRRSRAFWCEVLEVPVPPARPLARELWPLS